MKKEQVLELLKKATGDVEVDFDKIDVDSITDEWNNSINGAIKAETERAKEATKKELLSNLGYESEDEIKKAIESTKTDQEKENDRIEALTKEVETLKTSLTEKDNVLRETSHKEALKKAGVRDDRVDQAYRLVKDDLTEDADLETVVKSFVENTPEWTNSKDKRQVTLDKPHDGGEDKEDDAKTLEEAWG